ncbi:MAG: ATP-binding protein [Verrucomicrobiia bacterium]
MSQPLGFSIRCPHCFEWTDWDSSPDRYVVDSEEEWKTILDGLRDNPDGFVHDKQLRCRRPLGECPAPFQAIICPDHLTAHRRAGEVPGWATRRAFQLCQNDHDTRFKHPSYCGLIFSTWPVPRQRHIELEKLLDLDLLSRMMAGISLEIAAPVTVYAAKYFERLKSVYWVPVEAYDQNTSHVPPHYNAFCRYCRSEFLRPILAQLTSTTEPAACPLPLASRCHLEEATCAQTRRDWNRCPVFIEERKRKCPCYQSDLKSISTLMDMWSRGRLKPDTHMFDQCWAGFGEITVPIIVHEHLVGMGITGQFLLDDSTLPNIDSLCDKNGALACHRDTIVKARAIYDSEARDESKAGYSNTNKLRIPRNDVHGYAERLRDNCRRIANVATAKYQNSRFRSEAIFKLELLGHTDMLLRHHKHAGQVVPHLLKRMREFWAFSAVHFMVWVKRTEELRLLAEADARGGRLSEANGSGITIGSFFAVEQPVTPEPVHCHLQDGSQHVNSWISQFLKTFLHYLRQHYSDEASNPPLSIQLVPTEGKVYVLALYRRDLNKVSPLRRTGGTEISSLCLQSLFDTNTEVIRRLELVTTLVRLDRIINSYIRGEIALSIVHDTTHPIIVSRDTAKGALDNKNVYTAERFISRLQRIYNHCEKALYSNAAVREFCRSGKLNKSFYSVNAVINECYLRYKDELANKQIVAEVMQGDIPLINMDIQLMTLVFVNLLENASKYLRSGQKVSITTVSDDDSDRPVVRIQDNGIGIPMEVINEVLCSDIITCDTRRVESKGLHICRAIIEDLHSGSLDIEHVESGGTLITIKLGDV